VIIYVIQETIAAASSGLRKQKGIAMTHSHDMVQVGKGVLSSRVTWWHVVFTLIESGIGSHQLAAWTCECSPFRMNDMKPSECVLSESVESGLSSSNSAG